MLTVPVLQYLWNMGSLWGCYHPVVGLGGAGNNTHARHMARRLCEGGLAIGTFQMMQTELAH